MVVPNQLSEVVAPCDLEGGYLMDIELNGEVRTIVVPDEGVQQGETFVAIVLPPASPVPLPESPVRTSTTTPKSVNSTIPTGAWRDGICDFFNNCTVCCMSWCCGSVILGQVMTRLHLNPCCCPTSAPLSESNTCKILSIFFLVYVLAMFTWLAFFMGKLGVCAQDCITESYSYWEEQPSNFKWSTDYCAHFNGWYDHDSQYSPSGKSYVYSISVMDVFQECAQPAGYAFFWIMFTLIMCIGLYFSIAMCRTRQILRETYRISGDGCADYCCSFVCPCCTVSQMARHTNDYRAYPVAFCGGDCFSKTGQNADARAMEL